MRTCRTCHEPKPLDQFHKAATRCRPCGAAAQREARSRKAALSHRVCPKCERDLPASAFSGGAYQCKECRTNYNLEYRATSAQRKLVSLRATAKHTAKRVGVPFNLTNEHLWGLWDSQEGRCHYTGTELTFAGDRAFSALSLDRMVPEVGYIQGNVVLTCWGFNRMKFDLPLDQLAHYCEKYLEWYGARP